MSFYDKVVSLFGKKQKPKIAKINLFKIENGVLIECLDKNLEVAVIPQEVEEISVDAFWGCKNLKIVDMSNNSVRKIGWDAFGECESLEEVRLPPTSLESIDSYAFFGCHSLKGIVIPYSVREIGDETFKHCDNLKTVIVMETVGKSTKMYIGRDAFPQDAEIVKRDCWIQDEDDMLQEADDELEI